MFTRFIFLLSVLFLGTVAYGQTYFLNGTAQFIGNDCYRLTQSLNNQNGAVWYADQIDLTEPFNIEFDIYLGLNDFGADGIVFVLQNVGTGALGDSGGGMGYAGFSPSLGIEFDTWQNSDNADLAADHIAVISQGNGNHNANTNISGPVQASVDDTNVEDGQYHQVNINWDPVTQNITVLFDCEERISTTYDIVDNIFNGQSLVYWGFTGATGGANNNQIVCLADNILSVGPNVTICNGASTVLDIAGDPEGIFVWTPEDGLDDPFSGSPTASPDSTTTYVVQYNNLCGSFLTDSVTVTVQDLEVDIDVPPVLTCEEPVQPLASSNNFDNDVQYSWTTDEGVITEGADSSTPEIEAPGWYVVEASFDDVCFAYDSVLVEGDYVFSLEAEAASIVSCYDPTTTVDANASPSNLVQYSWTTDDGSIVSGNGTQSIEVDAPGTYTLVAAINQFCEGTVDVEVEANFETSSAEAGSTQQIDCDSPSVNLQGSSDGTDINIFWTTDNGNLVAGLTTFGPVVDEPGIYTITITNTNSGCETTDEVEVIENFDPPLAEAGLPDTLTCSNPTAQILGAAFGGQDPSFSWSTNDGNIVDGAGTLSPTVDQPGTYIITVVDNNNGCVATDEVQVVVNEDFFLDISSLTIPNIITPNGDGSNDVFKPFLRSDPEFDLTDIMQEYTLSVYNRWGTTVHDAEDGVKYWDGFSNGDQLPDGTYYYILHFTIDCDVQEDHNSSGHIQVIN